MHQQIISLQPSPELLEQFRAIMREELAAYVPPAPVVPDLPEYPTRQQTARKLQVSLVTLNAWAKPTDERPAVLLPVRVNGRVRYRRDDVLNLLQTNPKFKRR
ncbi:MAG: DNA-binding protein [Cytophagales bacterium]|nr:MAG: DNA-binding protein [Cytophagales bacterium]